jgi:hypothetical protein
MKKLLATFAAVFAAGSIAWAAVGIPPIPSNGPGMVDGTWLNGVVGGLNYSYQSGFTAAGTTQATSLQLPSGIYLMEVDTAAASTGVALPPCIQGTHFFIYNNGAQTLTIYPSIVNNPITAAQDTINNGTSLSGGLATHTPETFFCAKNGVWAAK